MKNGRHEDKYGNVRWYQNNMHHRTNGPAIVYPDSTEAWYILGHKICETKKPADGDK